MAITFDFINELINVDATQTTVDMQSLINAIRDEEDELSPAMAYHKIADAYGKDDLGGGVYTAITIRLIPNWQLKFADRTGPNITQVFVTDGNLVGGNNGIPIAASAFVQVIQQSSAAGTISIPPTDDIVHLKYLISTLQDSHNLVGTLWYWDPYGGSDSNSGTTPSTAVKSFSVAQAYAASDNYDTVIALATDPTGVTTTTESVLITKNTLRLKGPGYNFQIIPSSGSAGVYITADNIEVSGVYISTGGTGSMSGIRTEGNNTRITNSWLNSIRGHGINIAGTNFNRISNCVIETTGISGTGNGINFTNGSSNNLIEKTIISESTDGINLSGASSTNNIFENILVYDNSNYGVVIGSGVTNTVIRGAQTVTNNTVGQYDDNGTNTIIDNATGLSANDIADAVWDEVISDHLTASTTGKTLRDAKTKATLASIK